MSDALVSAILQQLTTIIYEEAKQEVKLVTGVGKEIKRLENNLESIQALLDDAEERQMKEKNITIWLGRLKEVCYDMEDVLDEWNTALLKLQVGEADQKNFSLFKGKVCRPFFSCFRCGQVVQRHDIALKIKDINERLDEIAKGKDRYQLTARDVRQPIRAESTSFTEVSKLQGRDEVKKNLIDSLLCGNSDEIESDVKMISIVGMGGIGKTALAQLVYNDEAVVAHFDKKIWVCVSEVFDRSRIAKAIIMGLAEPDHASARNLDSLTLQILLERIRENIKGKKVLLVLDDVWTDDSESWESFNQAFKPAAPGSRVLVTTRKDTVVKTMKSSPDVFPLEQLSEDVCWKILCQEAFVGRGDEQCKNLEGIGKNIAKKCSGLPLAAKTLGSMLRSKKTREEWTNILNSEMWELDLEAVFAPLLLSYFDLPSAVRRCFLYCSTFRKGVEIERDDLIYQWMAQGYLNSSQNRGLEITGVEYFECLAARSFFQDLETHEDGSIRACKIHDIVLDFARFLMGNEFVVKEVHPHDENSGIELFPEKTHHLLLVLAENACFPTPLVGAEKLRSLSIFKSDYSEEDETSNDHSEEDETGNDHSEEDETGNDHSKEDETRNDHAEEDEIGNLLIQLKHLRSLIFCGGNINGFPEEVGKLMHLKLLDLSDSKLKRLPEAICGLLNLQSLFLRCCYSLEALPDKIEKLVNLRHLDTCGSGCSTYYPKGIGRLTSLRTLLGIVVSCDHNDDKKFSLGDLENLCQLRSLALVVRAPQIDANEARRAKLRSKIHLKHIELAGPWSSDETKTDNVSKVLNAPSQTNVITDWERPEFFRHVGAHALAIREAYLFRIGRDQRGRFFW
ncbi:hypothetical protein SLEP1_g41576 [Rubroshorea leprosula]|uniref:Disease resistance protein RGA3 n=1 Tax=Rubroshorea leprosula TaxID=152421 RepID=A0AAV5L763_9ROSI|nr:hypothetical protein SLEP1_g41576 [Rubroshorea leprosula]